MALEIDFEPYKAHFEALKMARLASKFLAKILNLMSYGQKRKKLQNLKILSTTKSWYRKRGFRQLSCLGKMVSDDYWNVSVNPISMPFYANSRMWSLRHGLLRIVGWRGWSITCWLSTYWMYLYPLPRKSKRYRLSMIVVFRCHYHI